MNQKHLIYLNICFSNLFCCEVCTFENEEKECAGRHLAHSNITGIVLVPAPTVPVFGLEIRQVDGRNRKTQFLEKIP
jgi:hypothetical protein